MKSAALAHGTQSPAAAARIWKGAALACLALCRSLCFVSFALLFLLPPRSPHNTSFKFPAIQAAPFSKVFRNKAPADALDLIGQLLRYDPRARIDPLDALAHPFFDPLRADDAGKAAQAGMSRDVVLPPTMFHFTDAEVEAMGRRGTIDKIVPPRLRAAIHWPRHTADSVAAAAAATTTPAAAATAVTAAQ
jgi:hypothetical protein